GAASADAAEAPLSSFLLALEWRAIGAQHRRPLLRLRVDAGGELRERSRRRIEAELHQSHPRGFAGHIARNLLAQPDSRRGREAGRREHAVPRLDLESWKP